MESLQIDRRRRLGFVAPENARRAVEKLTAPLRDLVRMHIELLRQFGQRLFPLDRSKATLALNAGE